MSIKKQNEPDVSSEQQQPRCLGLDENGQLVGSLELDRSLLHSVGFDLFMRPWLRRARESSERNEWFEALIYLWVTFNAWLSQIIVDREFTERDFKLVQAAGRDPILWNRYENLRTEYARFNSLTEEFHGLWPVFKVRTLLDKGLQGWYPYNESRAEYRSRCFDIILRRSDFRPRCCLEHQMKMSTHKDYQPMQVPNDWAHAISAIYQVRCNLFHGGKSFRESRDIKFARLAFDVLWNIWGRRQLEIQYNQFLSDSL